MYLPPELPTWMCGPHLVSGLQSISHIIPYIEWANALVPPTPLSGGEVRRGAWDWSFRREAGDYVAKDYSLVPRVSHSGGCLWNSGRPSCSVLCIGRRCDSAGAAEPGASCWAAGGVLRRQLRVWVCVCLCFVCVCVVCVVCVLCVLCVCCVLRVCVLCVWVCVYI